jgi:hypothetical protein
MIIGKVIHSTRSYIYILTLLLFPNIACCQLFPYLQELKDSRDGIITFDNKLKGMTTLSGYSYASSTYDKHKREVNIYYDIEMQKAIAEYSLTFSNSKLETHECNLYESERYNNYTDKVNKIGHRRNRELNRLDQQYNHLIKVYSPYWSRNDRKGKENLQ